MQRKLSIVLVVLQLSVAGALAEPNRDPLPSWNAGPAKESVLRFVKAVTDKSSPQYVVPEERVAVFDNDGTLYCEQPMYGQMFFAFDRVRTLAPQHPEWNGKPQYKAILDNDTAGMAKISLKDMLEMVEVTHAGLKTEQFSKVVTDWLATARHPRFQRPFNELVYQPMIELLGYLRANGFKTYIVSGGGLEFMRPWTQKAYGIGPEQTIGSWGRLGLEMRDNRPVLVHVGELGGVVNEDDKVISIYQHVGRRPIAAFGNSDGDLKMLEWTAAGPGARFTMLVHHTDAEREYAYDRDTQFGKLNEGLGIARERGWTVVDMKADWARVFPAK